MDYQLGSSGKQCVSGCVMVGQGSRYDNDEMFVAAADTLLIN